MPTQRYTGPPMTLGNMRENGVRSLAVYCLLCHHPAGVDQWPDHVTVPSFGPRTVCTSCGMIGADARPNWAERAERPTLTGNPSTGLQFPARNQTLKSIIYLGGFKPVPRCGCYHQLGAGPV
jgi:hypothetical protein